MPEYLSPEEDERQEVPEVSPSALAILNQSEHASMVQTANVPQNRRKLADFESKLMAYANHSQPIALLMFYSLPRSNKQIIGPSVRFAEIVAPCWRNCAVGGRVVGDAATTVTAQGIFLDYELNMRNSVEVPRRITDKDGRRYSDDMVITTSNAAMSVARRNAVLKGGVPQALWTPSYEAAQLTAVGKADSHAQRVASAMDYLNKLGVTEWQILSAVGVASIKDLETEHLVTLRVLCSEIKRGDKTIEQVFGSEYDKEIDALFAQLKKNQAQQTMLRNSYLGRAQELVTYLREQAGPGMSGAPINKEPFRPAAAQPQVYVSEAANYSSGEALEKELAPQPVSQPQDDFNRVTPQPGQRTVTVAAPDGGTSQATVMSGGTATGNPNQQTSMEPGTRRRGRPTREEMARRQAAQQGTLVPQTENEQDARQEAEEMVQQADQFAF